MMKRFEIVGYRSTKPPCCCFPLLLHQAIDRTMVTFADLPDWTMGLLTTLWALCVTGYMMRRTIHGWWTRRFRPYTTPDGETFVCTAPDEVDFLHRKIFVEQEYGVLIDPSRLTRGQTIVDVGGNIGVFARWAAKTYPESQVIAFEPIPPLYECLVQNLRSSDRAIQRAVGRTHEPVQMEFLPEYTMLSGKSASLGQTQYVAAASPERRALVEKAFTNTQTFVIPSTTLETALADVGEIGLLKVDVEGMEKDVFDGIGDKVWPQIQQIVAEVHVVDDRLQSLTSLLEARGFRCTTGSMAPPCFKLGENAQCATLNTCLLYAVK
jgi:FkbM family methyltransferase